MKISVMIKEALEKRGLRNLKQSSQFLGISTELLRMILNKDHIPKDKTLSLIAKRLELNAPVLILAAHQASVPEEVQGFFLPPTTAKLRHGMFLRKHPLSQEQCDYLCKMMTSEEIQLVRKLRQVTEDGKKLVLGYIDYMFSTQRIIR
jgi:hypothetical protein